MVWTKSIIMLWHFLSADSSTPYHVTQAVKFKEMVELLCMEWFGQTISDLVLASDGGPFDS